MLIPHLLRDAQEVVRYFQAWEQSGPERGMVMGAKKPPLKLQCVYEHDPHLPDEGGPLLAA